MLFRFFAAFHHPLQNQCTIEGSSIVTCYNLSLVIQKCINMFGLTEKNLIIYIKSILKHLGEGCKFSLVLRQPTTLKQSVYNQAPGITVTCGPQYTHFMECHRFTG